MHKYIYGGESDVGYGREVNEDFIQVVELDDNNLLSLILDGVGSKGSPLQPASIVAKEIVLVAKSIFEKDKELFLEKPDIFLEMCLNCANRVLGGFKLGNEEIYGGFAAAVTCCLMDENGKLTFAHAGNTRLYLLRENKRLEPPAHVLKQLTKDHTAGMKMVDIGDLTPEEYHTHASRLDIYSGMGVITNPAIQTFSMKLKENDIILMTTDGIHCAIRPEIMTKFILDSGDNSSAAQTLITGAKTVKYVDNMSAIILWYPGENVNEGKEE